MRFGKQFKCLILAILIFLSGMWYENGMADSFAERFFAGDSSTHILEEDEAAAKALLCTEDMLSGHAQVNLLQLAGRFVPAAVRARLISVFCCFDTLASAEGKFFAAFEEMSFFGQCPEELVVNYIHQSDGKKKI